MKKFLAFFRDGKAEEIIGRIAIFLVIIPVILNIFNRAIFSSYSLNLETIALFAYVWIGYAFFGYLYKKDSHVEMRFIVNYMKPGMRKVFDTVRDIYTFVFSSYMVYWGIKLCMTNINRTVAGTKISYIFGYSSIVIGFFSGACRSGYHLYRRVCRKKEGDKA
jgi:TRAP-type C4-dicarboxylate transport system permease small subunit